MKKNIQSHQDFYKNNRAYTQFLGSQKTYNFEKYTDILIACSNSLKNPSGLDVGCGTGIALQLLRKKSGLKFKGVEISKTSLIACKRKNLDCDWYSGLTLPFKRNSFSVVSSINVLEHTDDPKKFLDEQLRILKKNGFLVLFCPNFLAISNGYHGHTRGVIQKCKNVLTALWLLMTQKPTFFKMQPVFNKVRLPDDDAVNVTNHFSVLNWARKNNLNLEFQSSQQQYTNSKLLNFLDTSLLKEFLGSVVLVFRKN